MFNAMGYSPAITRSISTASAPPANPRSRSGLRRFWAFSRPRARGFNRRGWPSSARVPDGCARAGAPALREPVEVVGARLRVRLRGELGAGRDRTDDPRTCGRSLARGRAIVSRGRSSRSSCRRRRGRRRTCAPVASAPASKQAFTRLRSAAKRSAVTLRAMNRPTARLGMMLAALPPSATMPCTWSPAGWRTTAACWGSCRWLPGTFTDFHKTGKRLLLQALIIVS
mgnify:CR=1 FL=1